MTKHEQNIMSDLVEAIKESVDLDAISSRLGISLSAADDLLAELKQEGFGICEHGIIEGNWCEPCNKEYKRAAADPENQ